MPRLCRGIGKVSKQSCSTPSPLDCAPFLQMSPQPSPGGLPHHAEASAATCAELIIFQCFYGAQVRCEVCVRCCQGQCCTRGSGRTKSLRRQRGCFRGASAELAAALQVTELIESKRGRKALPSPMRRAGGEHFIPLLFPGCFEFSPFEKGGLLSAFT